ncbi:hypothetical protein BZA05DRAFT_275476 [Tricharina praecox]|uniref:uncharacterized protein n=1 Tax=Tricharina praecox TaxID=43433 RepID=UPI00221FD802|nr:uncharacterized protein BZA05DRAFT_275476 [Tricharina praecox]KAI5853963.1 hypothetical protein BZA05DRAFT_275476 [Tricharina praecox]
MVRLVLEIFVLRCFLCVAWLKSLSRTDDSVTICFVGVSFFGCFSAGLVYIFLSLFSFVPLSFVSLSFVSFFCALFRFGG